MLIKEHYQRLNKREQTLVIFGGIFMLCFLVFYLLWEPIIGGNAHLKKELENKQSAYQKISSASSAILSNVNKTKKLTKSDDKRTLASRISIITKRNGIKGMGFSTKDANKLKFDMKNVSFIKLHKTLFELESKWGVQIESANIRHVKDEVDSVNASFVIKK